MEGVRVSAHTFRHPFARRFLERWGDFSRLSRFMGHTEVKTTEKDRKRVHQSRIAACRRHDALHERVEI
jgi:integrase/recombinase XerD